MRKHIYLSITLIILSCLITLSCGSKPPAAPVAAVQANKRILGVSPWSNPNYELIKAGGIGWVRLGFEFPFEDKIGGKLSEKFVKNLDEARKAKAAGLRIMGVTPLAGIMAYDEKDKKTAWRPQVPDWAGPIESDSYYDTYQKGCEELGRQTKGIVEMWQVSNEMDIDVFHGPLSIEQAERFLTAGARGLKAGNPDAKTDINPAGLDTGEPIFRALYSQADSPFDYAGIDGYFGSWAPGGPQDWVPVIEKIHAITGKPVLINEWGYSSIEGSGKPLHKKIGNPVCEQQKWNHVWGKGHTPEEQAAYVEIALKIFGTYPNVVGCFFYDWGDDAVCYHCGQKNCPGECGWGMTDPQGKPKPAYDVFKTLSPAYF
ncbi:MAG: hypothetical protein ACLQVL_36255 [Terriglobia bacterium]